MGNLISTLYQIAIQKGSLKIRYLDKQSFVM